MKNHTIHYTQRHTQSHGHKPTLLTITQLLPGTTVISHIALLINYFLSRGPLYSWPPRILNQFGLYTKTREKAPKFLIYKLFLLKWMILEYIPLSPSESATCKDRREDTMRIRSHRCTGFGSFGDSSWWEQWWSGGNPSLSEHTCSGWKARPLPGGWNFQVHFNRKWQNSFLRGNLAAGERTLYSTGCNGC